MLEWWVPAPLRGLALCSLLGLLLVACGGGSNTTETLTPTAEELTLVMPTATLNAPLQEVPSATAPPGSTAIPTTPPAATPTHAELTYDAYISELDAMVAELQGHYGIMIAEPDGTPIASYQPSDQFESASLYKLGVMVEIYRQREMGELTFDEEIYLAEGFFQEAGEDEWLNAGYAGSYMSVEALLLEMIDASSNAAAWALLDHVGTENVNATMAALGLGNTVIRWSPSGGWHTEESDGGEPVPDEGDEDIPADEEPVEEAPEEEEAVPDESTDEPSDDEVIEEPSGSQDAGTGAYAWVDESTPNVTSAEDVAWLYAQLLQGSVVSPEASAEMLALLMGQQINDRLPAYLPEGVLVAHKTGNLDGIVHDAGVIYAPAGPVIVVVLSDEVNPDEANLFIASLGELTYWYFS